MDSRPATVLVIIVFAIMASATAKDVNPQHSDTSIAEFIKSSCQATRYPRLCVSSLSPYTGSLKPTLCELVKAAMNVSLVNARTVSVWAAGLKGRSAEMSERERAALNDCIQNFDDTVDEIQKSLKELEQLQRSNFNPQMNDMQTFMSAALTDQDSCLNGFEDVKAAEGKISAMVKVRVQNESELISNALALLNALALNAFSNTGVADGIHA